MLHKLNRIILFAVFLAFVVITLGAYTRLKDAGLGCPDWPGCYGNLVAPSVSDHFSSEQASKAWIEMIHRYIAGSLGLLILFIAIQAIRLRNKIPKLWITTTVLLALVVMQALLGMWTVTLRLYPIVVMGHLLGGFAIIALLWHIYLRTYSNFTQLSVPHKHLRNIKILAVATFITLLCQIALGGWTSANYAALVCADFPTCQGQIWPNMDWLNAFNLLNVGIFDSPGEPLQNNARVTIQMAHRIGALITTILISFLSLHLILINNKILKISALVLLSLLCVQIGLGIINVLGALPLYVSLAHNAVAVLLMLSLIYILFITSVHQKTHAHKYV